MNALAPKLIMSQDLPDGLEQWAHVMEDPKGLGMKQASELIFKIPLDQLRPAAGSNKVGIHVVALGDYERYGLNKNGDGFPEKACRDYHPTFVKHAKLYELHRNKDPNKKLGDVVASAYNPSACRIELFVHADRNKAQKYLHEIELRGTYPFSMAALVPWDECTICKHRRWFNESGTVCDHIRDLLSTVMSDGRAVGTLNWLPRFHDISFVPRGADRIAYDLGLYMPNEKAASSLHMGSLERAARMGLKFVMPPKEQAIARRVLVEKLARLEDELRSPDNRVALAFQAAANQITPDQVEELRHYDPASVVKLAGEAGVVLSYPQFCQWVYGKQDIPAACKEASKYGVFAAAKEAADIVAEQDYFGVDPIHLNRYSYSTVKPLNRAVDEIKYAGTMNADGIQRRSMTIIAPITLSGRKQASLSPVAKAHAAVYGAYVADTISRQNAVEDEPRLRAVAAQTLQHPWS